MAAKCALSLQKTLEKVRSNSEHFKDVALRVGADFGPVTEKYDPVIGRPNYFGVHINRAARIEPVTPEGKVYVTWQFASELALENDPSIELNYVGSLPAAKSFGMINMYLLNQR